MNEVASRRSFLKLSGIAAGASAGLISGCGASGSTGTSRVSGGTFDGNGGDFGTGDSALFNVILAGKYLTTNILSLVTSQFYAGITQEEANTISTIYRHELAQLEFLKLYLGNEAIPQLINFDLTSIPLNDRSRVLDKIREVIDVLVDGLNGASRFLVNSINFPIMAQMASVDARHSVAIREFITPNESYFAGGDIISGNGLEQAVNPYFVVSVVRSYGPVPVLDTGDLP